MTSPYATQAEKKRQRSLKVIALPEKRELSAELDAMEMQGRKRFKIQSIFLILDYVLTAGKTQHFCFHP